jgi:adenosylcobinamide-GDP ribazoletransferase
MIARELSRLACATQFLTRLPTPRLRNWSDNMLARSARYFPLVGLGVGSLSAAVFALARAVWPSGAQPAILAVGAAVAITGGFHEDGLADTADGLGGGQTREQRLAIMKDSRLGSYGALALGLVLTVRIAALASLKTTALAAAALVCAHALARAAAVVAMAVLPYAADPATSKLQPSARGVRPAEVLIALGVSTFAIFVATLAIIPPLIAATGLAVGAVAALWPALLARRLIGGCTGDVLGAVEQAFETGFIVGTAAAAMWGMA